ncbi:hypothetical protein PRIPAC_94082 [Pristionchus pacificus]|uniref:Uncharacterized protein n=1 Tax=Pristionchus pacificus TaxID=54126 RepID=A0A2A6BPS7_PRIPA|nr:hypothetical protein PRIPAC_94082 [Pristionchus pacificus]|eukprot:PDM67914.1 hypothetical protein PRIPAC_45958 [Pristionchus pacificus]
MSVYKEARYHSIPFRFRTRISALAYSLHFRLFSRMFEQEMNLCYPVQKCALKLQNPDKVGKHCLKRKSEEPIVPSKKVKIEENEDTESSPSPVTATVKKSHKKKMTTPFVHHSTLPYSTYRHPSQFKKIGNYENLDEITAALIAKRKAERIAREIKTSFLPIDHSSLPYSTYKRPENFDKAENVLLLEDIAARLAKRRAEKDAKKAATSGSLLHFTEESQRFIDENVRPKIRITFRK